MNIAVLILCHEDAPKVNKLIRALRDNDIDIYVHVDKKSRIQGEIDCSQRQVYLLPDEHRVDVKWATFSMVEAELSLLRFARKKKQYDHYVLLSGSDYPITSTEELKNYLSSDEKTNYIHISPCKHSCNMLNRHQFDKRNEIFYPRCLMKKHGLSRIARRVLVGITGGYYHTFFIFRRNFIPDYKFFYGSQWWCLSKEFVEYVLTFLENNSWYINFFKYSSTPDESFFQTLLMNSQYKDTRRDFLHYLRWNGKSSPVELTKDDFEEIIKSKKMFARKVNDDELIHLIDEKLSNRD